MNFYKHHLGDYAAATMHLSWDEDMAFSRLLRVYYQHEKPISPDKVQAYRLARAITPTQKKAVDTVLLEFFVLAADGWHQKRCDEEISAATAKAERNREVGKGGGRPKKLVDVLKPTNNPDGLLNETQAEPTNNPSQTPDTRLIETSSHHSTIPAVEADPPTKPDNPEAKGTPEGRMAMALIKLGVAVTSINPKLTALIQQGVTIAEAVECVGIARTYKPAPEKIAMAYLEQIIISQRNQRPSGTIAEKPSAGKPWFLSADAIARRAWDLGLLTKTLTDRKEIEDPEFHAKVFKAAGITAAEVERARAEWEEKLLITA